jgi:hypothetical protein
MRIGETIRQGDVFVRRIAEIPATAKEVKRNGRIVLAYGEVTGHAHAIAEDWVTELQDEANRRYLDVRGRSATLVHEEHTAHVLDPGVYEVVQQVELSDDDEPRVVGD